MLETIPGLVVGIVTALVAVQLGLWRFRWERVWEQRLEAYRSTIEALYLLKKDCNADLKHLYDAHRGKPSEEYQSRIAKAHEDVRKAIALASLLMSPKVAACLEALDRELDRADDTFDEISNAQDPEGVWGEYVDITGKAVEAALMELKASAKRDLGIDS